MPVFQQSLLARTLCAGLFCLAAACSPPPPTPDAAATAAAEDARQAAETAAEAERATDQALQVATDVAATLTAQPTDTATASPEPTATNTPEPTATDTPEPTATDTPAATATETNTPRPTSPPVTVAPTALPAPASVYGFTSGPASFNTLIVCTRNGVECTPEMPPGDIAFEFLLGSDIDAPFAVFLPYGLSVERDGANVADMFMFVDAGYLPPDSIAWFGSSRNFTAPGRYVIRSSGCMATSPAPCGWTTMAGTTVTFVIR